VAVSPEGVEGHGISGAFNPLTAEFILGPAIRPDPGAELPLRGSIERRGSVGG
jgi:hypothetical protein